MLHHTTQVTPEQRLFQLECLRAKVRTIENAMFHAYFSTQGAAFIQIESGLSTCLATMRLACRTDKCPDGSEPNSNGMCEWPAGSGNWVTPEEAAVLALND